MLMQAGRRPAEGDARNAAFSRSTTSAQSASRKISSRRKVACAVVQKEASASAT
jgi:hypothetical protein